jgi:Asp-tRNA(Asn)/Glu-tRNA(Gln) amidotransferase A subunit family amidase
MLTITNFTGHPSLCLPAGLFPSASRDAVSLSRNSAPAAPDAPKTQVPHSICLYGRLFDEASLMAFGERLEAALGVMRSRPPI